MSKLPPITGMPAKRPACANCGNLIPAFVTHERAQRSGDVGSFASGDTIGRTFRSWNGYAIDGSAWFCTLRCARSFATAAYKMGFRRKG